MKQNMFDMVFKVEVTHPYFENNICNCVQFTLKPDTAFLLKRFNFVIKATVNGFELYSASTALPALLTYVTNATGLTSFDFELTTNNSAFSIFTDLPFNWTGQLQYDTQSPLNKDEQDFVELIAQQFSEQYSPTIGTLVVHFDGLIKGSVYKINYQVRATQWQYFIINKSAVQLRNPKIIGKSGIEFKGPQNTTLATGVQAFLFSSDQNLIPLSALPSYKFDLVDAPLISDGEPHQKNTATKIIVKGLPNPSVAQIGNLQSDIKVVSSPMYVYV